MINRERLVASFIKMVSIDSISRKEKKFMEYLKNEFEQRGFEAWVDQTGNKTSSETGNLLLFRDSSINTEPVMFSAHMDTVVNGVNIRVVEEEDMIRSNGKTILGADDKAGIAMLLEAIDATLEENVDLPPLEILFSVCEELGLLGIKNFDCQKLQSEMAFVLDAGDDPGCIVVQSPCQNFVEYKVIGRAAHAGMHPEQGINAIHVMAKALAKMECGRIDSETTCNFGTITGGEARNIVADHCKVGGETRSLERAKLDEITDRLTTTFLQEVDRLGAEADVRVEFLYPEIKLSADDPVVCMAAQAARRAGLEPSLIKTGGGSDASIINGFGIPCANLGVGMRNAHTNEEYVMVEDLVKGARWIQEIIQISAERAEEAQPQEKENEDGDKE